MNNISIESNFPDLVNEGYEITSPATTEYNCIAWAAGEDQMWWWPDVMNIEYWPENVQRIESLENFINAYGTLGYLVCNTEKYEEGFEKVAIFTKNGEPTHAARQLPGGEWTSKLGDLEDISHSLKGVEGNWYGEVTVIMKRHINKHSSNTSKNKR